jgi:molybdopterin/thiamine biosynthesis adenylyltransferase
MNRLVFTSAGWTDLRKQLLSSSPLESAAALVVTSGTTPIGRRIVVYEILHATDEDYLERSPTIASLNPTFVARVLKRARLLGGALVFVHTHPLQRARLAFSSIDRSAQTLLAPTLFGRAPAPFHGSLVVGPEGFVGALFDETGQTIEHIDRIAEVGKDVRHQDAGGDLSQLISPYFDRNVRAFGKEGQLRLASLKVGVVGVGGTGSSVVEQLARLGVGTLLVIDPEEVEETNLNRLFGSVPSDIGRSKVEVASQAAKAARPDVVVLAIEGSALFENAGRQLLDCDFVFCCTDTHGSRAVLNQLSYQYMLPMIDIGVRIDAVAETVSAISTRVQMLAPSLPCLNCYPLLNPVAIRQELLRDRATDPYIVGFHEPQPAVISINAATSSNAVTMFLSAAAGFPGSPRHLIGRPMDGFVRPISGQSNLECVVCAPQNAFARADSWPMIWASR